MVKKPIDLNQCFEEVDSVTFNPNGATAIEHLHGSLAGSMSRFYSRSYDASGKEAAGTRDDRDKRAGAFFKRLREGS